MKINTQKHARQPKSKGDGTRILVTRYWLRGLRREAVDQWEQALAPSKGLLGWLWSSVTSLTPGSKAEATLKRRFRERYVTELTEQKAKLSELRKRARAGETITLLCACHDPATCHRTILGTVLRSGLRQRSS